MRQAATITGRVQGVSFRWYTSRMASQLGLTGWARNAPDGSVEIEVQGDPQAVRTLLAWAETGPSYARVDQVVTKPCPIVDGENIFEILSW